MFPILELIRRMMPSMCHLESCKQRTNLIPLCSINRSEALPTVEPVNPFIPRPRLNARDFPIRSYRLSGSESHDSPARICIFGSEIAGFHLSKSATHIVPFTVLNPSKLCTVSAMDPTAGCGNGHPTDDFRVRSDQSSYMRSILYITFLSPR